MTLGEKIVYYRDKKGWTQKALAERMGITPTRLNYWEKDKREPDVKMLNILCRTLEVDPKVLLSDEEIEKAPAPSEDSAEASAIEKELIDRLVSLGLIEEGLQLTDADVDFLIHVSTLISMWFDKRSKGE